MKKGIMIWSISQRQGGIGRGNDIYRLFNRSSVSHETKLRLSRPISENSNKLFKPCFQTQKLEPSEKQTKTTEGA